jgi:hypothetical protein
MWAYCALLIAKRDNALIRPDIHLSPYELFNDCDPAWLPNLYSFGEMAIVKETKKIQAKLKNRGYQAIYLGPAEDHKKDVYNFWNPKTRHCIQSRNAVFLQRKHNKYYNIEKELIAHQIAAVDDEKGEMYDSDKDVIPENDEGNHLCSS